MQPATISRRTALAIVLAVTVFSAGVAYATGTLLRSTALIAPTVPQTALSAPTHSFGHVVWLEQPTVPAGTVRLMWRDTGSTIATAIASVETSAGDIGEPQIHYNRVVYSKRISSPAASATVGWDVFVYNFDTQTESRITSAPGNQINPDIYGDWIVYEDNRHVAGNHDIYLYDMREQRETQLTTSTALQEHPSVGYDSVVYEDHRNGNWDIYATSLYTHKTRRITTNASDQRDPSMGDGIVAYEDHRNGNWDIYVYDLWHPAEKRLTTGRGAQVDPDVSAQRVVWTDKTLGEDDIYLWEKRFGTTHALTDDSSAQVVPDIAGQKLLYMQWGEIRQASLRYPRLTVSAPNTVGYRGSALITGKLQTDLGTAIPNRRIDIQRLKSGNWVNVSYVTTGLRGTYSYRTPALTTRTFYRATYRGGDTYLSARNWTEPIVPHVYLTRPTGPVSMSAGSYTAYGYIKPRHPRGSHSVALVAYRKEADKWVYKSTAYSTNCDYSTYTRYRGQVSLTQAGEWRVRARHHDSVHGTTYSSWRYITVR